MTSSAVRSIRCTAFIVSSLFEARQQVLAFAECKPQRGDIFLIKYSDQQACKGGNVTEARSHLNSTSVIHIQIPSRTFHIRETINLTPLTQLLNGCWQIPAEMYSENQFRGSKECRAVIPVEIFAICLSFQLIKAKTKETLSTENVSRKACRKKERQKGVLSLSIVLYSTSNR